MSFDFDFDRLKSDGTAEGTSRSTGESAEQRAIIGEELWIPPSSSAGVVVTERTALQYAAFLATLNTVASDVAVLPLKVYQRMPDDSRREAREHRLTELLERSPNGGETTPVKWRQSLMGHALEYGNGYAEVQRTGRGAAAGLHLLDPETTSARRNGGSLAYQLGNGRWLDAANTLHVAGFGYDGTSGYSFVKLLRAALGIGMAADSFAGDFFANDATAGGIIEVAHKLDEQGRKNLREGWEYQHAGAGNHHRVRVLEQGTKFVPNQGDPESSQLAETRKFQVLEVIRAWRVPPSKVGDYSQAHLANLEASNLDYLMSCLNGWLIAIEQEFSLKLFSRPEWQAGYYLEHDLSGLLRADVLTRYKAHEIALRNGWANRDEVRKRENLPPMGPQKGGDIYTIQSQNIPLDQAGKHDEPPPPGSPAPDPDPEPDPGTSESDRTQRRFNPNHGKDGKFGAGHGTLGGHGDATLAGEDFPPARVAETKATVESLGRSVGEDWSFEAGPPRTAGEAKHSEKAEASQRFLVRKVETPSRETIREGETTVHKVAGDVQAVTMRSPPEYKDQSPAGDGWISRQTNPLAPGGKDDYKYRTEKAADKDSRNWANYVSSRVTVNYDKRYDTPKDLDAYFKAQAAATPPGAAVSKTSFRLVVPAVADTPAHKND